MRIAEVVLSFAALALPLSPAAAAKVAPKATVSHDWSRTVVATPEGGFRMGNPNAKVTLVEYGSLACPHCRHFEETGYTPLVQRYVRTGQVSYEFRNLLINGPDISISLLAHCAGPAKFFPMSQLVYATQPQWQKKLADMSDADKAEVEKMTDQRRVVRFAQIAAFGGIAARFGVTPARAQQCLADPKGLQRLLDMTKAAIDNGIHSTPTFLIDGKETSAATWEDLEPQLKAAVGGRG
jgi:protein-disulfide isomerase